MTRLVYEVRVVSKNFISDFVNRMINIIGGRLKSYEKIVEEGIKDASEELTNKYPTVFNVGLRVQEFTQGAMMIIVYGSVIEDDS